MIRSMFYARFHTAEGSKIVHEVPEGSITPSTSPSALRQPLFDFSTVSDYIIPRQEFCDHLLTVAISDHRIIGYPVCISDYDGKYARNEFIFNLALVIDEDVEDWTSYANIIRKLGRLLRALEEQSGFLSKEEASLAKPVDRSATSGKDPETSSTKAAESAVPEGKIYALCEMILEDLNNYRECMIPIDEANTINLKLFPLLKAPAPVHAWHVPLLTINLSAFSSQHISSDLTLQRVLPYINGVNSVSHISILADTDLSLTRKAIRHLVYYSCVLLLDIFQFGAIYAPTPDIHSFVTSEALQRECVRYVTVPRSQPDLAGAAGPMNETSAYDTANMAASLPVIEPMTLIMLYVSLRQGVTLKNWVLENLEMLAGIDIRRLITFGVIKGFLYRVHKYVIAASSALPSPAKADASLPHTELPGGKFWGEEGAPATAGSATGAVRELPLEKYMDGIHSFDEICTELQMSERAVMEKMKAFGDVHIIHK
ncbi:nitrogen permease regulator 2 [Pseudovirgaria hyperparasitica]|uniref:Nitrogen permease regulator 2 n=1 Tax=Pseudovirgaria hyperparasitica TaxID=470096 RepID=A0A6A6WAI8_9PEZI|nr:nitrogen permease regulator 2 [Pseudovirgaria hyperparasitica]KAF2758607.1 nitrogen permease regulator 2 [Pseudovirgaria hyperparasitica]